MTSLPHIVVVVVVVLLSYVRCVSFTSFQAMKYPNGSAMCATVTAAVRTVLVSDMVLGTSSAVPDAVLCGYSCSSTTDSDNCNGFNYATGNGGGYQQCQFLGVPSTQCRTSLGDCQYYQATCSPGQQGCISRAAVNSSSCSFPFTYDGQIYYQCTVNKMNTCDVGCLLIGRIWTTCSQETIGFTVKNKTTTVTIQSATIPLMSVNGWLTIMSRINESFPTGLQLPQYEAGFGDILTNFWFGLRRIYELTNPQVNGMLNYRLRMEMQINASNRWYSVEYDSFYLDDPTSSYVLRASNTSVGDMRNLLKDNSIGSPFDTTGTCTPSMGPQWPRQDYLCSNWYIFGISGVKSQEDLVMSNTDLSTVDPFGAAPFKLPPGKQKTEQNDSDGSLSSNEDQGAGYCKLKERDGSQELLETKTSAAAGAAVRPVPDTAAGVAADPSVKSGILAGPTRLVKRAYVSAATRYNQFFDSDVDSYAVVHDDGSQDGVIDGPVVGPNRTIPLDNLYQNNDNEGVREVLCRRPKTPVSADTSRLASSGEAARSVTRSRPSTASQQAGNDTGNSAARKSEIEELSDWANPFDSKRLLLGHGESETRTFDVFGSAPFRKKLSMGGKVSAVMPEEMGKKKGDSDVFASAPFVPQRAAPRTTTSDSRHQTVEKDKSTVKSPVQLDQSAVYTPASSGVEFTVAAAPVVRAAGPLLIAGSADLYGSSAFARAMALEKDSKQEFSSTSAASAAPGVAQGKPGNTMSSATVVNRPARPDSAAWISSPAVDRNSSPFASASRQHFRREVGSYAVSADSATANTSDLSSSAMQSGERSYSPYVSLSSSCYEERDETRSPEDGFGSLKRSWRSSKHKVEKDAPTLSAQFANLAFSDEPDALLFASVAPGFTSNAEESVRQFSREMEPKSPLSAGDESNFLIPSSSAEGSHTMPRSFSKKNRQTSSPVVIPTSPTDSEPFSVKKKSIALL